MRYINNALISYDISIESNYSKEDYHDNNEVEPTPSVGEILLESEGEPLDQHLEEEDNGEDTVHVVQNILKDRAVR